MTHATTHHTFAFQRDRRQERRMPLALVSSRLLFAAIAAGCLGAELLAAGQQVAPARPAVPLQ
ncbi:MAG: hypothetical protein ACO3ZY_01075, partial [Phycisphaerales bacterium]